MEVPRAAERSMAPSTGFYRWRRSRGYQDRTGSGCSRGGPPRSCGARDGEYATARVESLGTRRRAHLPDNMADLSGPSCYPGYRVAHRGGAPASLVDGIEAVVVNYLHRSGDTHGAHVDDHEVAFALIVEAPPPGCGGELLLQMPSGGPRPVTLAAGDAYILHASAVRHAVAPVTARRRIAVVCAYDLAGRPQPHLTRSAALLYG